MVDAPIIRVLDGQGQPLVVQVSLFIRRFMW
jgi:hypothetical protein